MKRKTLEERLNDGGPLFYAVAVMGALGFIGFLWLTMAIGIALGLQ